MSVVSPGSTCSASECGRKVHARGLCGMHYQRFRKHGDTMTVLVSSTTIQSGQVLNPLGGRSMMGDLHPNWKGQDAGYGASHTRVVTRRGKASEHPCVDCGSQAAEWSYDHTDPDEKVYHFKQGVKELDITYSTNPEFYEARCKSCHTIFDAKLMASHV